MNQSKIKSKVTLIATIAISLFCLLLIIGVVEIRKVNVYQQRISAQERELQELQNAKNYYNSKNYENTAVRDQEGLGNDGDIIFGEE